MLVERGFKVPPGWNQLGNVVLTICVCEDRLVTPFITRVKANDLAVRFFNDGLDLLVEQDIAPCYLKSRSGAPHGRRIELLR